MNEELKFDDVSIGMLVGVKYHRVFQESGYESGWRISHKTSRTLTAQRRGDEMRFDHNLQQIRGRGESSGLLYPPRIVDQSLARKHELDIALLTALHVPQDLVGYPRLDTAAQRVERIQAWAACVQAALAATHKHRPARTATGRQRLRSKISANVGATAPQGLKTNRIASGLQARKRLSSGA